MPLIEFVCLISAATLVITGAVLAHERLNLKWGWLIGGAAGFISFLAVGLGVAALRDAISGPPLGPCQNGCCKGPGIIRGDENYTPKTTENGFIHVCQCGIPHRREGRRFMVVNKDGTETSHLIWIPFLGWKKDKK